MPKKLLIAIVGEADSIEEFMSPVVAARLAARYHSQRSFLEFATEVAKEARRLSEAAEVKQAAPAQQLQLQLW